MILLDGANGKLGEAVKTHKQNTGAITYNFRGIYSSSDNLQSHFRVLLNDLEILVMLQSIVPAF